ncbi:ROK family protein, partial [Vibrio parahaemolyticus]
CGGGIVIDGKLVEGPRAIGGEWGHTPLPWPQKNELDQRPCWCCLPSCMETWVSGPALAWDYWRHTGSNLAVEDISAAA